MKQEYSQPGEVGIHPKNQPGTRLFGVLEVIVEVWDFFKIWNGNHWRLLSVEIELNLHFKNMHLSALNLSPASSQAW